MFSTDARESLTDSAGSCRHRYIHKSAGPSRWWDKQIINKTSNTARARTKRDAGYRQPRRTYTLFYTRHRPISSSSSFSLSHSSLCQERNDCFEFHEGANEFMVRLAPETRRFQTPLLRPAAVTRFTKVEEAILIILTAVYFRPNNSLAPLDSLTASRVSRNF